VAKVGQTVTSQEKPKYSRMYFYYQSQKYLIKQPSDLKKVKASQTVCLAKEKFQNLATGNFSKIKKGSTGVLLRCQINN
jgi:hypothetical protein